MRIKMTLIVNVPDPRIHYSGKPLDAADAVESVLEDAGFETEFADDDVIKLDPSGPPSCPCGYPHLKTGQ